MITPSRRTPAEVTAFVREATAVRSRLLWDGEGANPYPAFLAHADAFIVPADSVNMTGEPCATGKPVYVFAPDGGSPKFTRFHEALRRHGATRPLPDPLRAARDLELRTAAARRMRSRPRSPGDGRSGGRCWARHGRRMSARPDGMKVPIVSLVVATALFMENTDSTILATALPTIARDLGLDPISLKLAVTSYLVSLAVFIPVSGWVADRVGSCTTFRLALAVFMIASIGCAFSNSLGQFVFWRAAQGLGGAMMVPVGRMVVIRTAPKAELVQALSFIAMPALIGPDARAAAGRAHRHAMRTGAGSSSSTSRSASSASCWRRCSSPRSRRRRRPSMPRGSCCWRPASAA